MSFRTMTCPSCGAPLPPNAKRVVVVCAFCKATVSWDQPLVRAASYRASLAALDSVATGERRVLVAGVPYRLLASVGRGESSDVYLAERARRITERVVVKLLRAAEDSDLLESEWTTCSTLAASHERGVEHFARLLPIPVARGRARDDEGLERAAYVYRHSSGFAHTLDDVLAAYPRGAPARHLVWIWKRLLEVVGFAHRTGVAHGAILPSHVLVHARDHGIKLVGWSCAARVGEPLRAMLPTRGDLYPPDARAMSIALDLAMSARTVRFLAGEDFASLAPTPLGRLITAVIDSDGRDTREDAWALVERISEAGKATFGPPRFVALDMPD